jgi:pimeloyl-ACP methyl ester carboxylesterase
VRKILLLLLTLMLAAPAAMAAKPPAYYVDESKLPFDALPGIPSQRLWGMHNNAGYRIEVPYNWNGELVLWAHGYRGNGLELTVDDHPLRPLLLAYGFAWAASSYSKNAYDPAQGAKDTHALGQFFSGKFGRPTRTYITGASMGGHVTAVMAEQWPGSYAGAMPICGVLGDYQLFDFFLDFNVAAQALSGVGAQFPFAPDYLSATVPQTKSLLGPLFPFVLNLEGSELKALTALRSGGARPVFDQGFLYWNGFAGDFLFGLGASIGDGTLPRHPGVAVDNTDVVYEFDGIPGQSAEEAAFNAAVQRVAADPQGRLNNGIANIAPTNGNLKIPMLTMHTLGDLFVPFRMEQVYAERVAAHGASSLLVQRAIRDVGHCAFSPAEMAEGFMDLVTWVEAGVKPAGDDVLDPAVVGDPDYGCRFTRGDRNFPGPLAIPPCPAP